MTDTASTPSELDEALARIEAEVAENQQVDRSAELLIGSLAQQLREAATTAEEAASDPDAPTDESASPVLTTLIAKLNQFADSLDSSQGSLSTAVTANTPASPEAQEQAAADLAEAQASGTVDPAAIAAAVVDEIKAQAPADSGDWGQQTSPDKPAGEWDGRSEEEKAADEQALTDASAAEAGDQAADTAAPTE